MKITIKNLGVIKKAEFDTSKKLTVFCGPNSTGKTYLAYIIYAVYSILDPYDLKSFDEVKNDLLLRKNIKIGKKYIDELLSKTAAACKKRIGEIFGVSEESKNFLFKNFRIKLTFEGEYKDTLISDTKNSYYTLLKPTDDDLSMRIWWLCMVKMSAYGVSPYSVSMILHPLMLPVERNSINTFKTYLSINRNQLLDTIFEIQKSPKLTDFIEKNTARYPLAIQKSLYTAYDLEYVQMRNGNLYDFATKLENDLLHGSININKNGEVKYKTKDGVDLPISISSSIVKTLASLVITLKYQANIGNLLIIDEPEMNLHPVNQVLLATVLAQIANQTPMIVSTHSDYIIRELNNLIVAKSLEKKGKDTYKEFYEKDSLLDYKDVQVLYFDFAKDGKVNVKSLDVDEYGFAVDSMDDTINKQNERMQILFGQIDD